jgi:8-oxo-dGTP pyrophosphatase MutT (NUDIX family)
MLQMYKVFMNDKPIIITDSVPESNNLKVYNFENLDFLEVKKMIKSESILGLCLLSSNLEKDWTRFQLNFKVIFAAGGKVLNMNSQVLFIYRFDKWDLPKGHIENGEDARTAAIREVKEECGIDHLIIKEELTTTYHVFELNTELRLKVTYWFSMETAFNGVLVPQKEEGILEAVFKSPEAINFALKNTYPNIKLLF